MTVALSTSSVYPDPPEAAFDAAARLGYDAVEVMVALDETSQDAAAIRHLSEYHEVPVCAIHSPTLLLTQRVWGTDPWEKLERSAAMAAEVGAGVVVVHPPFRWQREYAASFVEGIADLEERTGIVFAVENMYPWRASRREVQVHAPHWDPTALGYAHTTLDVSHAATAQVDALELARRLGRSLHHLHLTDGSGSAKDEHLIPGRGTQPVAELLGHLAGTGFAGSLVVEVNTRRSGGRSGRDSDLGEALAFTRRHFEVPHERRSPGVA